MATRPRPNTSAPTDGSRTLTLDPTQTNEQAAGSEDSGDEGTRGGFQVGVLRLRGGPTRNRPRVQWGEEVIDNEGLGRKKSKICCIYHKPRPFDESSSSESDSTCSSSEDSGSGSAKPSSSSSKARRRRRHHHHHHHHHDDDETSPDEPGPSVRERDGDSVHTLIDPRGDEVEPNKYEKQPVPGDKGKGKQV